MSYVLLQCVKERSKLRVKMISSQPFIKGSNCQFPRDIREEGMYYVVKSEGIKLNGKFYSARRKDMIVCQTVNLDEVKRYINNLEGDRVKPQVIFGDDDDMECIICMSSAKDSVFAPCGHYICCSECALKCDDKCPMCRATVTYVLRRDDITD